MSKITDTALECLYVSSKMLGIPTDKVQLQRAYVVGSKIMTKSQFIRAGRDLGLKVGLVSRKNTLTSNMLAYPCIAVLKNGSFSTITGFSEDKSSIFIVNLESGKVESKPFYDFMEECSDELILLSRNYGENRTEKQFGISWFLTASSKHKNFLFQVLGISFLLQLIGLGASLLMQVIIDKVLVHRSFGTFDSIICALILLCLMQSWMTYLRSYLFTNTVNKIDVVLGDKLFRHILALPLKFFEKVYVGDVVARMEELTQIRQFITGSALTLVLDIFFVLTYFIVMVNYSFILTLITVAVIFIFIVFQLIIAPLYRKALSNKFNIGARSKSYLIETLTGIQTVKSSAVETQIITKWEEILSEYVKTSFRLVNISNVAGNIASVIQQSFIIGILWVGANAVIMNKLTLGELIAFQMIASQVIEPMLRLVNMWQSFQSAKVSIDRIGDILNTEKEPSFNPNRTTLPQLKGHIKFERVSFRYNPHLPEVVKDISFDIKAGMKVGIVGRSGSGKSTLTKLLQKIYTQESGRILIDGIDISQVEAAWLRRQMGVVLQDNFLFNGSVSENLTISKDGVEEDEMLNVSRISGVEKFIGQMPKKYDTPVGEMGSNISGGERQRIAIGRALINNPRIVIFDEATSALDYESENIIMQNIEEISKGRTMFIIAHRLSTVRNCDLIIVLEKGQIKESGSHTELILKKGFYYNQYIQQIA